MSLFYFQCNRLVLKTGQRTIRCLFEMRSLSTLSSGGVTSRICMFVDHLRCNTLEFLKILQLSRCRIVKLSCCQVVVLSRCCIVKVSCCQDVVFLYSQLFTMHNECTILYCKVHIACCVVDGSHCVVISMCCVVHSSQCVVNTVLCSIQLTVCVIWCIDHSVCLMLCYV